MATMNITVQPSQALNLLANLIGGGYQLGVVVHVQPGITLGAMTVPITFNCNTPGSTPLPLALPEIILRQDGTWEARLAVEVG